MPEGAEQVLGGGVIMEEEFGECELPPVLNDSTLLDYCLECDSDWELCREYYEKWEEEECGEWCIEEE